MHKKFMRRFMPMMDQVDPPGGGSGGTGGTEGGTGGTEGGTGGTEGATVPEFDYEKLASIIAGKSSVTEEKVLKGYFEKQGLSKDEVQAAIAAFKEQKAQNTPDVAAVQQQLTQEQAATQKAQQEALEANIKIEAIQLCGDLGVDTATMMYMIKLADMGEVVTEGKIDTEKLKAALAKVLEDLPQLKPQQEQPQSGFRQIGNAGTQQQGQQVQTPNVPSKKWNRWNN